MELETSYKCLMKYLEESAFFDPDGIHGVAHSKRVLQNAYEICAMETFSDTQKENLLFSAAFHDLGRNRDGIDSIHGLMSWKIIKKYHLLDKFYPVYDSICIKFLVTNHCIDDDFIIWTKDNIKYKRLLYALKDADGLDRKRINDFDATFIRLESSKKLMRRMGLE